ncbi:3-oxoacyl-[acyl-carrier-protein] reductase FabG [Microbacterium azadirachtae]|uniref:3-oxoacyl-[acyl-carrier-protein] reductase FabG n=1 Tax=Microbacterium azadirachtae TaxID=582680 RepID=A0A0F0KI37_9MICO|nr:SDR family oxidoreductase [Microbacterium azadirachtae]KJL19790.1 3-oxoacyl-[acyl-carrier-protein] reductase FabG [Microbacterium azadirachtae]
MSSADAGTKGIALVTGASGSIGASIARTLANDGYHVVVHYRQNKYQAEKLCRQILSGGHECTAAHADLEAREGPRVLIEAVDRIVADTSAPLTVVVNNAALLLGPTLADATPAEFDRYLAINLRAPFFLTQLAADRMGPGASIVNISSAGAHFPSRSDTVYAISKAALEALTDQSAALLAERGIRVNTVIPGPTDTAHPALEVPAVRQHLASIAAFGELGEVTDVAHAVSYLVSEQARRSTGTRLDVSGGSTFRGLATNLGPWRENVI